MEEHRRLSGMSYAEEARDGAETSKAQSKERTLCGPVEGNRGSTVKRHRLRSRDDLAVFISLTAAISILVSAAVVMWVWPVVSDVPVR